MENLKYEQTFENKYSGPKKLLFVAYLMGGGWINIFLSPVCVTSPDKEN